ncbi:hypothetical protein [Solirubrobacter soli]|uniref:hypothetical protein n=1 Tax=Solirubrobacter soli TaxID=363832 RepID=UPI00040B336D|nr:hypothetical protein [Solirubrobacter soli]
MAYSPRQISFLGRSDQTKHYAIAAGGPVGDVLVAACRDLAEPGVPGFTIAHEGKSAAMALVYWWAEENEVHRRAYAAPLPLASASDLVALTDTAMACVWELEVIDFERRAWLSDVLVDGDLEGYLSRALEPVAV